MQIRIRQVFGRGRSVYWMGGTKSIFLTDRAVDNDYPRNRTADVRLCL